MDLKATARYPSGMFLQRLLLSVLLLNYTEAVLLGRREVDSATSSATDMTASWGIDKEAEVFALPADQRRTKLIPAESVPLKSIRREVYALVEREGLEEEQEGTSGISAGIIAVCIVSCLSLTGFCSMAVWMVWAPMTAIFEERAYEQAARQAFRDAVPDVAATGGNREQNAAWREEQLTLAWKKFLDNPLLQIGRSNLLARVLHKLLDRSFDDKINQLFTAVAEEGDETISRAALERVIDGLSFTLYNMHSPGKITIVQLKKDHEVGMAVAELPDDYGWLLNEYHTVFTDDLPMDKPSFGGVVKLVIVWNAVRTLHTARHMKVQERDTSKTRSDRDSNNAAVHITIDPRNGFQIEAEAEVSGTDAEIQQSNADAVAMEAKASSSGSAASKVKREPSGIPEF